MLLFAYAFSWGMVCMGMAVTDPESAQALSFLLVFPIAFVSYALVPTNGMPAWLRTVANWNPLSSVSAGARELFGNPNPAARSGAWPLEHAIPVALGWSALILVIVGAHGGASVPLPDRRLTTVSRGLPPAQSSPGRPSMLTAFLAAR